MAYFVYCIKLLYYRVWDALPACYTCIWHLGRRAMSRSSLCLYASRLNDVSFRFHFHYSSYPGIENALRLDIEPLPHHTELAIEAEHDEDAAQKEAEDAKRANDR